MTHPESSCLLLTEMGGKLYFSGFLRLLPLNAGWSSDLWVSLSLSGKWKPVLRDSPLKRFIVREFESWV